MIINHSDVSCCDGIPPAPRGIPQIEVTFNLDANGILNVTAKDKGSGKEQSITIQNSGNLSKEDVEKAAKEAEAHAEEDKKKRESAESKNLSITLSIRPKNFPTEYKDKISDEDKKTIEEAVAEAKKVQSDEKADKEAYEEATKALNEKIMPIGAKMYEAETAEQSEEAKAEAEGTAKDEPIEGEVVDEKDKKEKHNTRVPLA